MFATPIIYVFFNRPEATRRTFARIREIRPKQLYLLADGPRTGRPDDITRCADARAAVESMIDWDCTVTRDYSQGNLGCGRRLSTGLTAAFAQLGEAIVLEDDILPHPDFFSFCTAQLEHHRDNPRIHSIAGFNPLGRYRSSSGPAVATIFNSIWGWASWHRSWKDYQFDLSSWKQAGTKERIRAHVNDPLIFQHFARSFDLMVGRGVDTWDFQWTFAMLDQQRHSVVSSSNLVENIGFDSTATHTTVAEPYLQGLHTHALSRRSQARQLERPDRLHDKLYAEVIMTHSRWKIAYARLVAQTPLLANLLERHVN